MRAVRTDLPTGAALETLAVMRAGLDEPTAAEAWEIGRGVSADEAIALALEELDA